MENHQGEHTANLLLPCLTLKEMDGVALVSFDDRDAKVNTLNSKLIPQFEEVLDYVEKSKTVEALVLISGKKDCFVAGADITELQGADQEGAKNLSMSGQKLFSRMEKLRQPVVAAIDGSCLGGGLELALACDYRLASSSAKTVLGLPEVLLGLLPGAGGTQRLSKIVGLENALKMMLTGMNVRPEKAKKWGLIDYLVFADGLEDKALKVARALAKKQLTPSRAKKTSVMSVLEKTNAGKKFILQKALQQAEKKTRGLYPAPKAIIDVLSYTIEHPEKGYEKESELFAQLSQTPQCHGLISLYFGQSELKKNRYGPVEKSAKNIAVLGAGLMGAGIGLVSLQKKFHVRLRDISQKQLASAKKYIWKSFDRKIKRKSMTRFESQKMLSGLFTQTDLQHFNRCDVVIEAVFEDLELKHKVLKEIEEIESDKIIFASNTSAIPISDIAKVSKRPERVIGMHYFSPVEKMPLLEIIVTEKTSEEVARTAVDIGLRQGKTVIVVKDGPGFYTTRILAPFMDEAAIVALEGLDFYTLDDAMKDFGYPVGPIALIDEVGVDVALHVSETLSKSLGERVNGGETKILSELISKGSKGRKSGKGFFVYDQSPSSWYEKIPGLKKKSVKKPINPEVLSFITQNGKKSVKPVDLEDVQKRLSYRMINEAAYCLQEGILQQAVDGDIGAVFGLGFPPFHGGPFRYVDKIGVGPFVDDLKRFEEQMGARFSPCPLLLDMVSENKKFYPV